MTLAEPEGLSKSFKLYVGRLECFRADDGEVNCWSESLRIAQNRSEQVRFPGPTTQRKTFECRRQKAREEVRLWVTSGRFDLVFGVVYQEKPPPFDPPPASATRGEGEH